MTPLYNRIFLCDTTKISDTKRFESIILPGKQTAGGLAREGVTKSIYGVTLILYLLDGVTSIYGVTQILHMVSGVTKKQLIDLPH